MKYIWEWLGFPRFNWEVYRDTKRKWRFRAVARNNEIIAVASQGYANKADAIHACRRLNINARIVVL